MTSRNVTPDAEANDFFGLLEEHQSEVERVLAQAAAAPWDISSQVNAIAGLADAEEDLALFLGQRLLRTVPVETLKSVLLHVGAFGSSAVDGQTTEEAALSRLRGESALAAGEGVTGEAGETAEQSRTSSFRTVHTEPSPGKVPSAPESSANEPAPGDSRVDEAPPVLSTEELAEKMGSLEAHLRGDSDVPTTTLGQEIRERYATLRDLATRHSVLASDSSDTYNAITIERDRLRALFRPHTFELLAAAPKDLNLAAVDWLICRLKRFQQLTASSPIWSTAHRESQSWFYMLVGHSKETSPGFLQAFQQDAQPDGSNWLDDSKLREQRLHELLGDEGDESESDDTEKPNQTDLIRRLINESRLPQPDERQLRTLIREYLDAGYEPSHQRFLNACVAVSQIFDEGSRAHEDRVMIREITRYQEELERQALAAEKQELPEDWPGFALMRGKRVLMLGGSPRREAEDKLGEAFDCESFEWMEISGGNRNAENAVKRLKNGTIDVVIVLLKFVAHAVSKPVFAARTDDNLVVGAWTYGLQGLARTLETHLDSD